MEAAAVVAVEVVAALDLKICAPFALALLTATENDDSNGQPSQSYPRD
jgi:hypothetical protein